MDELKKEILAHEMERKLLKSKMHQMERLLQRKEEEMDTIAAEDPDPGVRARADQSRLVSSLKLQVKEAQKSEEKAKKQLKAVREGLKATKIGELELEVGTYYQEILRLRRLMEDGKGSFADDRWGCHSRLALAPQALRGRP